MRQLILSATLGAMMVGTCLAAPPPSGWSGSYSKPLISCDTKEQIVSLADAKKKSDAELVKAFQQLAVTKDDNGEATCVLGYVEGITVGENEDLGIIGENGSQGHYWAVHVGTMKGEWWVLYQEKVEADKRETGI